jgi:hypothetical protein
MIAAPSLVIYCGECAPQLARGVRDNWIGAGVEASVPIYVPRVYAREIKICPAGLDE